MKKTLTRSPRFILTALLLLMAGWVLAVGAISPSLAQDEPGATYPAYCGRKAAPRKLTFSGKRWNVKHGQRLGPNSNRFSDSSKSVWVDAKGALHLKMRRVVDADGVRWWSAEICQTGITTYGMHRFEVQGYVDRLNPSVVLGLFLYELEEDAKIDELDIELARWGFPNGTNNQFVVQPYQTSGNMHTFTFALSQPRSTHYIDWCPEGTQFKSIRGYRPEATTSAQLIDEWAYSGPDNPPVSEEMRVHINLWLTDKPGFNPTDKEKTNGIEVVIRRVDIDKTPNVPVISLPANGAEVSPQPSFAWGDTDAANAYTFQLTTAADTGFATPIINEALLPDENAVPLSFTPETPLTPGEYLWRVSSFCGAAVSAWSETRAVTVAAEE